MSRRVRWAVRIVVLLVGCVFVAGAPITHLSARDAHRDAVRFTESGHVVEVDDPRDVRVEASEFKGRVSVDQVSVRIDGIWRAVRDSSQEEPDDLDHWYHSGSQPPLRGRPQWPPLHVLVADGVGDVVAADHAQSARSAAAPGPGFWVADALAVLVAVALVVWGRRTWRRVLG